MIYQYIKYSKNFVRNLYCKKRKTCILMSFSGVMNVHEHCFRKKMVIDFKQIVVIHVCVCIVDEILSVYPNYSTLHSRNTCI